MKNGKMKDRRTL